MYVVTMIDNTVGYGQFVFLIGVFDSEELVKKAVEESKKSIREYDLEHGLVMFDVHKVDVNHINNPRWTDETFGYCYSDFFLGGYAE